MTKTFELGLRDFLNFKKMIKNSPRLFGRAAGNVLNTAAFGTRKLAIRNIQRDGIVRNKKFVSGSMRVQKTRITKPIHAQAARVGSIKRSRFTGWIEQESGQKDRREYYATLAARRNSAQRQIVRTVRLNRSKNFPQPRDFKGGSAIRRAYKMISVLSRSGFTKPFMIMGLENRGARSISPGVYKFGSGKYPKRKIIQLQRFKSPKQTKRTRWMSKARQEYVKRVNLRTVWGRAVAREIKKIKGLK